MWTLFWLGFLVWCVACLHAQSMDEIRERSIKDDAETAERKKAKDESDAMAAEHDKWAAEFWAKREAAEAAERRAKFLVVTAGGRTK